MPIEPMSAHDARERYIRLVLHDGLGRRFNETDKNTVWHYSNIAGLNGILSSSSLWASDYRYMNDTSELRFGLDIIEMTIAHDEFQPELTLDVRHNILKEIAMLKRSNMNMYVLTCSFCMRGNVLSQWRAYARQDGIAIGFQKDALEKLANDQGYTTGIVYYYFADSQKNLPREQNFSSWMLRRVDILLVRLLALVHAAKAFDQALIDNDETVPFASLQQQGEVIRKWCAETASFIKHPAFEEEQEWRCTKVVDETVLFGQTEIEHRPSGTRIVPYNKISLRGDNNENRAVRQLVIGPNADGVATMHSVEYLARRYELHNTLIASPFQPLRV